MDRNKIVQDAHGMAKERGWWDGAPRSLAECAMLMITEMAEATECVRNGEPPVHFGQVGKLKTGLAHYEPVELETHNGKEFLVSCGGVHKPEGELIELADCAIRIADFFGYVDRNLALYVGTVCGSTNASEVWLDLKPLELHASICNDLAWAAESSRMPYALEVANYALAKAFYKIECVCRTRGWDLEKAIALKMSYNATRPYRHGNKLA